MSSGLIRIAIFLLLAVIILMLPSFFSPQETSIQTEVVQTPTIAPTNTPKPTPTASPTPKPTPSPTPSPSPTPTPEPIPGVEVIEYYRNEIPEDLPVNLLYDQYEFHMDYVVALGYVKVREEPSDKSKKIRTLVLGNRVKLTEKVLGLDGESHWYRITWESKGTEKIGYVSKSRISERTFQLDKMHNNIQSLRDILNGADTVYIDNYRNHNGWAPRLPNRKSTDEYGNRRDQGTAGYTYPGKNATFRYIPDGMLAVRLYEGYAYSQVYIPSFDYTCWVPNKNVSEPAINELTQVIVVDRKNQNCGVFYFNGSEWEIASLSFVTTGKSGEFSLPTPLGDFMAISIKKKFSYTADGTDDIVGYAPYVIRFSGGGYVHGVPQKYENPLNRSIYDLDGREALSSLGTVPRSHMCVRNYTSHAKFLYKWIEVGSAAIIVIE